MGSHLYILIGPPFYHKKMDAAGNGIHLKVNPAVRCVAAKEAAGGSG